MATAREPIGTRFSVAAPCPVCGTGTKGCSVGTGGLYLCRGEPAQPTEWRTIPPSPDSLGFGHYRNNASDPPRGRGNSNGTGSGSGAGGGGKGSGSAGQARRRSPKPKRDWEATAAMYAGMMADRDRQFIADRIGIPVEIISTLPLIGSSGVTADGSIITFPEYDAAGRVVGISVRTPAPGTGGKDVKEMLTGSARGLSLWPGWESMPGPLCIVEGASDVLALAAARIAAIGRPTNAGGVDLLVALLASVAPDRPIIVVGENDERFNPAKGKKEWPGRDGAVSVAARLADNLGRPVAVAMSPTGAKDVRAWLTHPDRAAAGSTWEARGAELTAWLASPAAAPQPQPELNGHAGAHPLIAGARKTEIIIGVDEHRVNDEAVIALTRHDGTYRRGGSLVHVAWEPPEEKEIGEATIHYPAGPRIVIMSKATLRERLTEVADWKEIRSSSNGATMKVLAHPPEWCTPAVLDRKIYPGLRSLHALSDYPCLVVGGKILSTPGYDEKTAVYYSPANPVALTVPDMPGREEVDAALEALSEVVVDFPFLRAHHKSAWLAGVLTPLARFAFRGPTPLFLVEANVPGAGKGLLVEVAHLIVRGEEAAGLDFPRKSEELEKVITALLARGETTASFDNVDGLLGGAVLNRLLTASMWEGRILSTSTTVRAPNLCTWWATGNNVAVVGDTARRVCQVRLESPLENPEERSGLRHENLKTWVRDNRPRLLSAALTLLRAYHVAGRPDQNLRTWGSYESWSALVRGAIVWAGWPDPYQSREGMRSAGDSRIQAMRVLLSQWQDLHPTKNELTCREIIAAVEADGAEARLGDLFEAVATLAPISKADRATSLGFAFRSFYHRVIDGMMLINAASHTKIKRWAVADSSNPLFADGGDGGYGGDNIAHTQDTRATHTLRETPRPTGSPPSPPSPPADESGFDLDDLTPDGG